MPTPTPMLPPSLLSLPRELRDQIYDSLWTSTPFIALFPHPSLCPILLSYALPPSGAETGLPAWLLTSKQFLSEGTQQLSRHGSWTVRLRSSHDASLGKETRVCSPLLARRVTLVLTQPLEGPRPVWPHVVREREKVVRPEGGDVACLRRVVGQLCASGQVREVRVVVEVGRGEDGARVDLEALEVLAWLGRGLERLEVVVWRGRGCRAFTGDFVEAVEAEVKRVGNRIMGSDEDPRLSAIFQTRGLVYAFEKAGEMELCRVDSAVAEGDC